MFPADKQPQPNPSSRMRTALRWLLAVLIACVLLTQVSPTALHQALLGVPLAEFLLLMLVFLIATFVFDTVYWLCYLRLFGLRQVFSELLVVRGHTYLLMILNYAVSVGGIGVYLHRRRGVEVSKVVGVMLVFMVAETLALVLIALLALFLINDAQLAGYQLVCSVVLSGALALFLLMKARIVRNVLHCIRVPKEMFSTSLQVWCSAIFLRAIYLMIIVAYHFFAFPLFGVEPPFLFTAALIPLQQFISGLPLTPAGLGTSQASLIFLFQPYGAPEGILALSLATFILLTLGRIPIGIFCAWQQAKMLVND